mmetsp:Transcript_9418/g.12381  ORF Transcript_9418/g.12381 Transcript_9418/m.12381 type:complete len:97 (-) Transcript_9418:162-452(-)
MKFKSKKSKMEDYCFDNIEGTPGWYWRRFPGFFSVEWYKAFSEWELGIRELKELPEEEQNKITEFYSREENLENGVCAELLGKDHQNSAELQSKEG